MITTAMATFETLEDAGGSVSEIIYLGIIPNALEVVDKQCLVVIDSCRCHN